MTPTVLAAAAGGGHGEISVPAILFGVVLLLANGFFVAAEIALLAARRARVEERAEPHVRSSRGIRDVERDHHVAVRLAKAIRRQVHVVPAEHHGQSRRHEPLRERLRREVRQVHHGHPAAVQLRRVRRPPVAVQAIGLIEELGELLGVDTHHGIERVHLVVVRHIVAPTKVRYPIAAAAHFAVSRRGIRPGDDVGVATRGG